MTGDGLRCDPHTQRYKCFKCGFCGDILDLIGLTYGLTTTSEKLEKACKLYGVTLINDPFFLRINP